MSEAVIVLVAILCMKSKPATARSMEVPALVFPIGITECFAAAFLMNAPELKAYSQWRAQTVSV